VLVEANVVEFTVKKIMEHCIEAGMISKDTDDCGGYFNTKYLDRYNESLHDDSKDSRTGVNSVLSELIKLIKIAF
jgi:hypothetical protein